VRLRLFDALGIGSRTGFDDMPALGPAFADGFASEALGVAIIALELRRRVVDGENRGGDHGGTEDEVGCELHDGVVESNGFLFCVSC
jgi:hypothetical protein